MNKVNIASWNATGIMSSASYANDFLKREVFIFLGCHQHNLHFLQAIHSNYNCFGVSDNDLKTPSNRKVGKGGVALLWHRSLDHQVSPLDIDSDRICGVQYRVSQSLHFYILQVYAPSSNHPIQEFRDFIDYLYIIISTYWQNGVVVMMGDFNAHLQGKVFIKTTDDRGRYLSDMMESFNLVSLDSLPSCSGTFASFVSYDDAYASLIDHVLLPVERLDTVISCKILSCAKRISTQTNCL